MRIFLPFVSAICLARAEELPDGVTRVSPAELRIERPAITPLWIPRPLPQGDVDLNPPWLHCYKPLLDGSEKTNRDRKAKTDGEKWNRRFYFKLSRDPEMKSGVLESGAKRWAFYNPYRKLEPGTWFWTYGVAPASAPGNPEWCGKTFSFRISGKEYSPEIPPTPEEFLAAVKRHKTGPLVTCFPEEIGNLLPSQTDPALARRILADCRESFDRWKDQQTGPLDPPPQPADATLLERKRAGSKAMVETRSFISLLRGYALTGDAEYKNLVLRLIGNGTASGKPAAGDLVLHPPEGGVTLPDEKDIILLDLLYDDLPEERRTEMAQELYNAICSPRGDSPEIHEKAEHMLYDNHRWQSAAPGLFRIAILLSRHKPDLDDWVKYAYELYLYRAPAFSRTDGGSSEGNGYLGVHADGLTGVPWLIHKLTGYNLCGNRRWFDNFSRYLALSKPRGNPGISFEDSGVDGGSDMQYFANFLARIRPENPANLWLAKSAGRRDDKYFSADLNKGSRAWDTLSIWKRLPAPDLAGALPPRENAAAFRDVGLVCMHTDPRNSEDNLMVNFRAGPYGSEGHTHPAQNAFTVAYGGQELFWRTGYYNGGGMHNIYSYKSSRAHNTIMVDGMVQGFDQGAYAWIARFADSGKISYALGDASRAYNGKHHNFDIPYRPDLKAGKVEMRRNWEQATAANGFGNPGVTRFRRHVVMLRPSHVLIYDELEAEKPVSWTFQLHSRREMKQAGDAWFVTANDHALGSARLFCAAPVVSALTDKFRADAVDEENKRKGLNPPNWHATVTTAEKIPATRFLTIIDVFPGKGLAGDPVRRVAETDGRTRIDLGDFLITAELDPAKPSYLEARDLAGTASLVTGQAAREISAGGELRTAENPGSTLLWEKGGTPWEIVDQLPDCIRYGNPY